MVLWFHGLYPNTAQQNQAWTGQQPSMSPNLAPGRCDKHFEGERPAKLLTLLTLPYRMKNIVQHWLRRKEAQTSGGTPHLQWSVQYLQDHVTPPGREARLWSQSAAKICLWYFENAGKPINSFDTSSSPAHPSWNLVWRFNPCWILKVVQALHAEVHLFGWCSRLVLLSHCWPRGSLQMLEWNRRV